MSAVTVSIGHRSGEPDLCERLAGGPLPAALGRSGWCVPTDCHGIFLSRFVSLPSRGVMGLASS